MELETGYPGDLSTGDKGVPAEHGVGRPPSVEEQILKLSCELGCSLKMQDDGKVTDLGGWPVGNIGSDGIIQVFGWGGE